MIEGSKRPFIPPHYPKSLVIFTIAGFIGLAFGGLAILGFYVKSDVLRFIGTAGFLVSWATMAGTFIIFLPRVWSGKYRNLPPRAWKDQIW